jgi:hypothetical protein
MKSFNKIILCQNKKSTMHRKVIDVGYITEISNIYLYSVGLNVDEIIFSMNKQIVIKEFDPPNEDLQFTSVISRPNDKIYSITFPLPVVKLVLEINTSTIIDHTESDQTVKTITFQTPVDVAMGVQITIQFQLDPSVFQDGTVNFNAEAAKICTPCVKYGMLTRGDERQTLIQRDHADVRKQLKTYKLD